MQNQNKQINDLADHVTKVLSGLISSCIQNSENIAQSVSSKKFKITILVGNIIINDVVITNKKSKALQELFKLLIEQHIQDVFQEKSYVNYSGLSIKKLIRKMKDPEIDIFDAENQIKEMVYRLRKLISSKLNIDAKIIIETVKNRGFGDQTYGYRLNPQNVVFIG